MKKIILILSILLILPIVYSLDECHEVGFCDGTYNLTCDFLQSDDYCPEEYGNWDSCKQNSYNRKCFPCDLDCGPCGNVTINVPSNPAPGEEIDVEVTIYSVDENSYPFFVYLFYNSPGNYANPPYVAICQESHPTCTCTDNICTVSSFIDKPTSNMGGDFYQYGVFSTATGLFYTPWSYGITKPEVSIIQPSYESTQSETFTIRTKAYSIFDSEMTSPFQGFTIEGGGRTGRAIMDITGADIYTGINNITILELLLFKETYPGNLEEVDPYDRCELCGGTDCNLIARWIPRDTGGFSQSGNNGEFFNYDWDSSDCGGDITDFVIEAKAYDANPGSVNSYSVPLTLNNPDAPCVDNCPKVSSNLLNLVVSKIKVWL